MAGETILIVEDVPESLKFTASVLRREGYRVSIASTAEQALSTLRFLQPQLILVDFMLPGMNGLELTARIKQDARLQKSVVVALTAYTTPADEDRARQAGCDGYLTKPIEARALVARVRDYLDYGAEAPGAYATGPASAPEASADKGMIPGLPDNELAELRDSFLKGGKGLSRQLLASIEAQFDAARASQTVHQWIGSAGLLGFPTIAQRAREVETVLRSPSCTAARLRGPVTSLARAFHNPAGALSESSSQSVARVLHGKRVALIGLNGEGADLMCGALEQVGAKARLFEASQSPYAEAVGICHLVVVHVRPENRVCRWLAKDAPGLPALPTIFFGSPEHLLSLNSQVQARASGVLMEGCLPEEVLMRLRHAVTQTPSTLARVAAADAGELVIAYADAASHPLLEAKMKEHGLRCRVAANGPETILLLRHLRPPAAVVDVSLDGFEALAAIRAEAMPVRTVFVTSQSHEDEILRGFSLGAEDYLVQPFSALELVARLKRLLG
jgi:DNA-binding response OmpR family regulator/HPt (histidine-containing phosphotransfer) domain-containing protein